MACEIKDPTNNPICSDSIKDLKDNAIIMDQYINSEEFEVPDRLGIPRKTWAGLEEDVRVALANLDPKVEQLIAEKIIAQGGVEIANDWGDSLEKVINQDFITKNLGYVTPEMFGAIGDGVTDDTDSVQLAINSGAKKIVFSNTYLVTRTITSINSNDLKLTGGKILFDGDGRFLVITGSYSNEYPLLSEIEYTTSTSNPGMKVFSNISSELKVGDSVMIQSNADAMSNDIDGWRLGSYTESEDSLYFSEIIVVDSVGDGWFTSRDNLVYPHYKPDMVGLSSDKSREYSTLRVINFSENIALEDLDIKTTGGSGSYSGSILISLAKNPIIRNVSVIKDKTKGRGIVLSNCIDFILDSSSVDNSFSHLSGVSQSHVFDNQISILNCWSGVINGCSSVKAGQSYDVTYGAITLYNDVKSIASPSQNILFSNSIVRGSIDNTATNHSGGIFISYEHCVFKSSGKGFLSRSPFTKFNNCYFGGVQNVRLPNELLRLSEYTYQNTQITNCTFKGGFVAIFIQNASLRGDYPTSREVNLNISSNNFSKNSIGIYFDDLEFNNNIDTVTDRTFKVNVLDNIFDNEEYCIRFGNYTRGINVSRNNFESKRNGVKVYIAERCANLRFYDNLIYGTSGYFTTLPETIEDTTENRSFSPTLETFNYHKDNFLEGGISFKPVG